MIKIIGFIGLTGIALGALGEHFLASKLSTSHLKTFSTAVDYHQLYSVLLLFLEGFRKASITTFPVTKLLILLFMSGLILFCGSLYLYIFTTNRIFAFITPFGGGLLIFSWAFLIFSQLHFKTKQKN